MNQNDPTDSALAAIASIFGPARPAEPAEDAADASHDEQSRDDVAGEHRRDADSTPETRPVSEMAADLTVDGYSRSGPGPLDSLRFKWTARRGDDGQYYVDETIGFASRPISVGPLPRDQVIAYIDERENAARQRFDALRNEMIHNASERGHDDVHSHDEDSDHDSIESEN